MKSVLNFKHFLLAMASAVMVGNLTSCKDKDFDWNDAHANTQQEKFLNVFVKEFGKPAKGHDWGFDVSWSNQEATRAAEEFTPHDVINKVDVGSGWLWDILHYGTVPDITHREHVEVAEWFRTHQVDWANTVEKFDKNTHKIYRKVGERYEEVTEPTGGERYEGKIVNSSGETVAEGLVGWNQNDNKWMVKFCHVNINDPNDNTRQTEHGYVHKTGELSTSPRNSLLDYTPEYWLNEPAIGVSIDFNHAWVQQVANDRNFEAYDEVDFETLGGKSNDFTSATFDYLHFMGIKLTTKEHTTSHTLDFNFGNGYGYDSETLTTGTVKQLTDDRTGSTYDLSNNGALICGVDFNQTAYHQSKGDSWHDKWIIVYLKGEDYEGWYLGFDYEADGAADEDKQVTANGYCDDWIFKLTSVDQAETSEQVRIFCEDLAADYNVNGSDIDYNDIVLDVNYRLYKGMSGVVESIKQYLPTRAELFLTPRAAGGTMPLIVGVSGYPLFEVHEFLLPSANNQTFYTPDNNRVTKDVLFYHTMINTNASEIITDQTAYSGIDGVAPQTFLVAMSGTKHRGSEANAITRVTDKSVNFACYPPEDWAGLKDMIDIKVHRFKDRTNEYIDNPKTTANSEANWVNLVNDGAPVKLCVPQTTKWLKERQKIDWGYSEFNSWVANYHDYFWTNPQTANDDYLYASCDPINPASGTSVSTGSTTQPGTNNNPVVNNDAVISGVTTDVSTVSANGGNVAITITGTNLGTVTVATSGAETTVNNVTAQGDNTTSKTAYVSIPANTLTLQRTIQFTITAQSSAGGNSATGNKTVQQTEASGGNSNPPATTSAYGLGTGTFVAPSGVSSTPLDAFTADVSSKIGQDGFEVSASTNFSHPSDNWANTPVGSYIVIYYTTTGSNPIINLYVNWGGQLEGFYEFAASTGRADGNANLPSGSGYLAFEVTSVIKTMLVEKNGLSIRGGDFKITNMELYMKQ